MQNPIPGMCIYFCQNESLALPGCKRANGVNWQPSDLLTSLRHSVVCGAQDLSLWLQV